MIARTWSGTVQRADAEEYAEYIRATGFAEYGQTPGNLGGWLLRHDDGDRTEFITLSLWDSVDAIRAFAGHDIDAAVLPGGCALPRRRVDGHPLPGGRPDPARTRSGEGAS
jgi:heme-degrading monooxygenase HmoA